MTAAKIIPAMQIEQAILLIRGQKVMLDRDLAAMYGVSTGNLNKAVRRNLSRFPTDCMFQLTEEDAEAVRFQFGILQKGLHFKYLPYHHRSGRAVRDSRNQTFLECGGKRSATPLLQRLAAPQSGVAAALCHRTPKFSRHSVRAAIHI
jgi:hypothetical protein